MPAGGGIDWFLTALVRLCGTGPGSSYWDDCPLWADGGVVPCVWAVSRSAKYAESQGLRRRPASIRPAAARGRVAYDHAPHAMAKGACQGIERPPGRGCTAGWCLRKGPWGCVCVPTVLMLMAIRPGVGAGGVSPAADVVAHVLSTPRRRDSPLGRLNPCSGLCYLVWPLFGRHPAVSLIWRVARTGVVS